MWLKPLSVHKGSPSGALRNNKEIRFQGVIEETFQNS